MSYKNISIILLCALILSACAGLPVRGSVGGQTIETRVDSEAAQYYLGSYLAGKRSDPALDKRIDRIYQGANGSLPDRSDLKRLSEEFSVDFAALYLADQIDQSPDNRRFQRAFAQAYEYARKAFPNGRLKLPAASQDYEVLVVPIFLYERLPGSGADLAGPRAALEKVGFSCHFVETDDDGAIEANADLVANAIRARAQSGRRLIVISASKSGAEVALALTKLGLAETRHVAAWINMVGVLQGTPVVDDPLFAELEFLVGEIDTDGKESLAPKRSQQRFDSFRIPEHVLVVNYFGVPVIGSISFWGRRGFFSLRKYGPNDGVSLLPDMIFPGGVTLTELGSDHFMRSKPFDITTLALTMTVIRWLKYPDSELTQIPGAAEEQAGR
ncbi:MAG TPA: hypothetical protein VEG60_07210 [Candidatus Binatia bacterium]|nr:hypothetical protein [Candidatus Binatia bacterium]